MKVDLSAKEIEMLDDALKEWQGAPSRDSFGQSLLSTMIGGLNKKDGLDSYPDPEMDPKNIMAKAAIEVKHREKQVLLLRAKLMQASAIESEHVLE